MSPNSSPFSIRKRLVLLAGLWLAAALVTTGLILAQLFRTHAQEAFDAELASHIEELVTLADFDTQGQLQIARPSPDPRFARAYSGWYWILLENGEEVARSRSLWDIDLPLPSPVPDVPFEMTGPRGENLRILARTLKMDGNADRPATFLVAGPQERINTATADFSGHLLVTFLLLGAGLIAAILIQVTWGLRPLQRLRSALADIRAGRAHRLDGIFPSEISPLTDEVNELLEHNTKVVERARTHAGNLAHALKTPLAALKNEAEALSDPERDKLGSLVSEMNASITHHLKRARIAAAKGVLGQRTELAETAARLIQVIGRLHARRPLKSTLEGVRGVWFHGERQDLEEMLGTLIENAFIWADSRVRVTLGHENARLHILIEDDGPGIPQERWAEVLERGKRLDETKPGSGLGLSIALDLAEAYGGRLTLAHSDLGGLCAKLELPEAA